MLTICVFFIFFQVDRYGRKLSETNGVVYLSPANNDGSPLNQTGLNQITDESNIQNYLLDPSLGGFFYRTDASLIGQWQLWDHDNSNETRPRPPASPFGLHEGLYHDDMTHEVQRHLRHMDNEEQSCSCSSTSKSSNSAKTVSTECSRRSSKHYSTKRDLTNAIDDFDNSLTNLPTSSLEPILSNNNYELQEIQKIPIIVEKVVSKSILHILNPAFSRQSLNYSNYPKKSDENSISQSNCSLIPYELNRHDEVIANEGNHILLMDTIQLRKNKGSINSQSYKAHSYSHRKRSPRKLPIIDIQMIEQIYNEKNSKPEKRTGVITDSKSKDHNNNSSDLTISTMLDIIDGNFEGNNGNKIKLNNHENYSMINHFESMSKQKHNSTISSINSGTRHRYSQSMLTASPSLNYVERPSIKSLSSSQLSLSLKKKSFMPLVLTDKKLNKYLSNIYGTVQVIKSSTSSTGSKQIKPIDNTTAMNTAHISSFRYMQSSINPNLLREYYNEY